MQTTSEPTLSPAPGDEKPQATPTNTEEEKSRSSGSLVKRRLTDGSSTTSQSKQGRSSLRRRTQEFLKRSNSGVLPPIDSIKPVTSSIPTTRSFDNFEDAELGYRSDTSDNGDDLDEQTMSLSPASKEKSETEKPVARLKRSLSGKFRGSSHKVNEGPPPADDTLHKALTQGNVNLKSFTKLLKRAAHIDQTDSKGQSVLHVCCARGLVDFIKVLIKRGSDVNLQDSMGYTPLHLAAIERQLKSCRVLLESKHIDVNLTTREESNVLHYLARVPVDETDLVEYRQILDSLIERGIDPNWVNAHLEAPIHFACMKSNVQSVALLLERGADCNLPTALNETPLHYSVRAGSSKLVRMLMENGADPTFQADDEEATPVDVAEQYQCADVLDCLQSIIEEELTTDLEACSVVSPRLRILENTIVKEGPLEVMHGNDWITYHVTVSRNRIICTTEKGITKPSIQVLLTKTEVNVEEGSIISDDDIQRWCFSTTERFDKTTFFGTRMPEEMEEWLEAFEQVIEEREKLLTLYQKLKAQSKPRKRLRVKERNLAINNCVEGVKKLQEITKASEMCTFLLEDTERAAAALSKLVNTEDENIIKVLTKYLLHKGKFQEFLKSALNHEIRTTAMGETLFREMSLSTRLLSSYLDYEHGKDYLRLTVLPLLNDIANESLDLGGPGLDRSANVQANLDKLVYLTQRFFDQVISSPNRFPYIFRDALLHTRVQVDRVFPNMTHAVVGGFVFLRFICPAIVTPHKFGLIKAPDRARREAVLITKILQTVSNGVEFDGTKEDYMRKLNPFIKGNRLSVTVFFDSLTNPISIEKQHQSYTPPKKLSKEEEENCRKVIFEHVSTCTERMDGIVNGTIRVCMPLQDTFDSDDEPSGVDPDEN